MKARYVLTIIFGVIITFAITTTTFIGIGYSKKTDYARNHSVQSIEQHVDNDKLISMSSVIVRGYFSEIIDSYRDYNKVYGPEGEEYYVLSFKIIEQYKDDSLIKDGFLQFIYPFDTPPAGLKFGEECIMCMDYYMDYKHLPVYGVVSYGDGVFYMNSNGSFENQNKMKFEELKRAVK